MPASPTHNSPTWFHSNKLSLTTMPMDLLLIICGHVLPPSTNDFQKNPTAVNHTNRLALTHFQLVCKRFRSVALLVPYLWTYVDDRMSVDRITMQMSHRANYAGDMGFRISYNPPTCKCGQWGLIRLHSSRWTSAYVEMNVENTLYAWPNNSAHNCLSTLGGLCFPQLVSLYADCNIPEDGLERWHMPCLKDLTCTSDFAFPLLGFSPHTSPLRTLTFSPTRGHFYLPELLDFLRTSEVSNLTHLTLDFSKQTVPEYLPIVPRMRNVEDIVALGGVVSMKLDVTRSFNAWPWLYDNDEADWGQVFATLSYLRLCSLEDVYVRCHMDPAPEESDEQVWGWLKTICGDASSALEQVKLVVLLESDDEDVRSEVYKGALSRLQRFTAGSTERGKKIGLSVEVEHRSIHPLFNDPDPVSPVDSLELIDVSYRPHYIYGNR